MKTEKKQHPSFCISFIIASLAAAGQASALTPVTETFSSKTINTARWTAKNFDSAKLAAGSGRLNFTVARVEEEAFSYLQLRNNNPRYNENWEVIVDVRNTANRGDEAGIGLSIFNVADPRDELFLEFYGSTRGGFNMIGVTDGNDNPSTDIRSNPRTTSGSMRISFDKKTRQLTCWFDRSGSANGYQWVKLGAFSTTGTGGNQRGNWKMKSSSGRFGIRLVAYGEETRIANGKMSLDNFRLRVPR